MSERPKVDRSYIRVKALAVVYNESRTHHAVLRGYDSVKDQHFNRSLGGSVELGEKAEDAVVREIAEELGGTYVDTRLLGVLENIFTFEGEPGHEVAFVYEGRLAEGDVVPAGGGEYSDNGVPMWVEWRPVDDERIDVPLYPDGVAGLIRQVRR
ncbi:MAG: NUDIX hydrolase [Nocardioidaceae bacterium]